MEKWSGALSCPDGTGKFYAVGLYYTEMVSRLSEKSLLYSPSGQQLMVDNS